MLSPSARHFICCLVTGSTQEDPSQHDLKIVDLHIKNQAKQTNKQNMPLMHVFGILNTLIPGHYILHPAADSHEILSLDFLENEERYHKICHLLQL